MVPDAAGARVRLPGAEHVRAVGLHERTSAPPNTFTQPKGYSAAEALEFGLVNRVVPADQLEATVEELAAKIAKAPLITLQATKSGILRAGRIGVSHPPAGQQRPAGSRDGLARSSRSSWPS